MTGSPTDGQLIALMSHTIGSIGQVLKDGHKTDCIEEIQDNGVDMLNEIRRIYDCYIKQIRGAWNNWFAFLMEDTLTNTNKNPQDPSKK